MTPIFLRGGKLQELNNQNTNKKQKAVMGSENHNNVSEVSEYFIEVVITPFPLQIPK